MIRRPLRSSSAIATLAAILILAAGCGDRQPVGAELRPTLKVGEVARVISAPTGFNAGTYARTIGPEGGVLLFGIGRLIFPAGALAQPTLISATVDGLTVGAIFRPHGLVFPLDAKPMLALSDQSSGFGAASRIVYVDGGRVILEVLQTSFDPVSRRHTANLRHFSPYILAQN